MIMELHLALCIQWGRGGPDSRTERSKDADHGWMDGVCILFQTSIVLLPTWYGLNQGMPIGNEHTV